MTSIFAEAWSDTRRDVRRGARRWLRRHPTSNLLAWGATTVMWTLPKKGILSYHRKAYRPRVTVTGRSSVPTVTTTETTTVTTSTTGGSISSQTVTTTTNGGGSVIHMSATSRLLGRGELGRNWASVIDQTEAWAPVQGLAATSIADACTDLKAAARQVEGGLEDLRTTFVLGNIDGRVSARIASAAGLVDSASTSLKKALEAMHRHHVDQINQEASGVPMAGPALAGAHSVPLETRTAAARVGLLISSWYPELGNVVGGVQAHLAVNKFAITLWGRGLEDLAGRLARYGVHREVCRSLSGAADDLRAAATALHGAQQAFSRLYSSQGEAEAAGATVIPINR